MTTSLFPVRADSFVPRDYQAEGRSAVTEAWANDPSTGAMLVMATGTGKTKTALWIAVEGFLRAGRRVAWLAHRDELVNQPLSSLREGWPELGSIGGIVQGPRNEPGEQIVFATPATLASKARIDAILEHGQPDLIVVDEAHHSTAPTHRAAIEALRGPNTLLLGLTATPDREDGGDLTEHWEIAYDYGIVRAISEGNLVPPYAAVAPLPELDLSQVSGRRDYDDAELGAALLKAHVVEHTVAAMRERHLGTRLPRVQAHGDELDARLGEVAGPSTKWLTAEGRGALVFTATVEQAELTAAALCEDGWVARVVSAKTKKRDRKRLIKAFEKGKIDVLCNACVLTEGTDLPRCSCVVLARPTKSWSLYCQMVGRALRLFEGKTEALIIDLAGATEIHDLRAAPVLIGGSVCAKSPTGAHLFYRTKGDKAECSHCGKQLPCFAAWEAKPDGAGHHVYVDGRCRHCDVKQCEPSETGQHHWVPAEDFRNRCFHCDLLVPSPMGSLAKKKRAGEPIAAWLRLDGMSPEIWAVDLGEHGFLYMVAAGDGRWRPAYAKPRKRKPRMLCADPLEGRYARALCEDVVRRAQRVRALGRDGRELYGAHTSRRDYRDARQQAALTARRLGLAS